MRLQRPDALLALVIAVAAPWHLWINRRFVPVFDEVGFASAYHGLTSGLWSTWNNWYFPLDRLLYNLSFTTFGIGSYVVPRLFALLSNVALALAVYVYARARGEAWFGVLVAAFLLTFGPASHAILLPLTAVFSLGIAAFPAAIVLLEKERPYKDVLAMVAILVALGFAGPVALLVCSGVGAWLLLQRPIRFHRLYVPAVPAALYLLVGVTSPHLPLLDTSSGIGSFLRYARGVAATAIAGLVGISWQQHIVVPAIGIFLLLVTAAAAVFTWRSWQRLTAPGKRRVIASGTVAVLTSLLLSATRRGMIGSVAPRYVFLTTVPILLIAIELFSVAGKESKAALMIFMLLPMYFNAGTLILSGQELATFSDYGRAWATALDLAGDREPDDYNPADRLEPPSGITYVLWVDAGGWRAIRRQFGTFGRSADDLSHATSTEKLQIDRVLLETGGVAVRPTSATHAPGLQCTAGNSSDLAIYPRGLVLVPRGADPVQVRLRRFADHFGTEPYAATRRPVMITPAADASSVAWHVNLSGQFTVCY